MSDPMAAGAMARMVREEARLVILRLLAEDVSHTSNSSLLARGLEVYGITKSRDWLHTEIRHLADLGAVAATDADSVMVVRLTARGLDHVERRAWIEGVKRPSLE